MPQASTKAMVREIDRVALAQGIRDHVNWFRRISIAVAESTGLSAGRAAELVAGQWWKFPTVSPGSMIKSLTRADAGN